MQITRADGSTLEIGAPGDQIYTWDAPGGMQYHWSIVAATAFAQARNEIVTISLAELGITGPTLLQVYPDLDPAYAITTDLSQPIIFVPIGDKVRLIDGGHRVCKALFLGVDALPAYFLTPEESEASLIAVLPALPALSTVLIPPQTRRLPMHTRPKARR